MQNKMPLSMKISLGLLIFFLVILVTATAFVFG